MLSSCLQPKSRGTVFLEDSDPFKLPAIDPNYLSHKEDVDCIIKGKYFLVNPYTALLFIICDLSVPKKIIIILFGH